MSTQQPRAHTLRLLLGDQLNPGHSWFATQDEGVVYVLMEVRQETDYVLHHAQKILAIFASMRDLARHLRGAGHRVRYVAIDDASNRQSMPDNLAALMAHYGAHTLQYQHPDEWRLDEQLRTWGTAQRSSPQAFAVQAVSSEHFYTTRTEMAEVFQGRKQWLMEHFYRRMRQRHSVLIDEAGEPEGGQWNYDHDNRKPWPGTPALPTDARPTHDHSALWATIEAAGVQSFGNPQARALRWPLNRAEALAWLDHFITTTLPHFGAYEDAMSTRSSRLFHSLLSFALNTKMLRPHEVVQRAQAAYHAGTAHLPAVEGFVRQILGWREYVRGIYWAHMPGYDERNALGHHTPLPEWFWTGKTRMLKAQGPWHCIIHAAGLLHGPHGMPEKRLGQLNCAQMEAIFRINTFGPALVLAHFAPLLPKQGRGLLAVLSAKVGSIGDNRLGGWYSYRASKAALNMLVKTASIEVARTHPQAVLVALHPGTVNSALSAPFNGAEIGRPAADAAGDMLCVLDGLPVEETGCFYAYSGDKLPW